MEPESERLSATTDRAISVAKAHTYRVDYRRRVYALCTRKRERRHLALGDNKTKAVRNHDETKHTIWHLPTQNKFRELGIFCVTCGSSRRRGCTRDRRRCCIRDRRRCRSWLHWGLTDRSWTPRTEKIVRHRCQSVVSACRKTKG